MTTDINLRITVKTNTKLKVLHWLAVASSLIALILVICVRIDSFNKGELVWNGPYYLLPLLFWIVSEVIWGLLFTKRIKLMKIAEEHNLSTQGNIYSIYTHITDLALICTVVYTLIFYFDLTEGYKYAVVIYFAPFFVVWLILHINFNIKSRKNRDKLNIRRHLIMDELIVFLHLTTAFLFIIGYLGLIVVTHMNNTNFYYEEPLIATCNFYSVYKNDEYQNIEFRENTRQKLIEGVDLIETDWGDDPFMDAVAKKCSYNSMEQMQSTYENNNIRLYIKLYEGNSEDRTDDLFDYKVEEVYGIWNKRLIADWHY